MEKILILKCDRMAKEENVMSREEAEAYLLRKGQIEGVVKYTKQEEKEIKEAMKSGKLYGDPIAELETKD